MSRYELLAFRGDLISMLLILLILYIACFVGIIYSQDSVDSSEVITCNNPGHECQSFGGCVYNGTQFTCECSSPFDNFGGNCEISPSSKNKRVFNSFTVRYVHVCAMLTSTVSTYNLPCTNVLSIFVLNYGAIDDNDNMLALQVFLTKIWKNFTFLEEIQSVSIHTFATTEACARMNRKTTVILPRDLLRIQPLATSIMTTTVLL